MKILFDHQIFSYQTYGGISRYFFELMKQFEATEGVRFELALARSDNAYLRDLAGARHAKGPAPPGRFSKMRFLATYLRNRRVSNRSVARGAYDVFHPTFFDPSFLRMLGRRPFVLTLHDMTPEVFPEMFPKASLYDRFVTHAWIEGKRTLAEQATKVIAVSEQTKQDVIRFYDVDPDKIEVIHQASSLQADAIGGAPPIDVSRPYLLFVGTRGGYKNFDRFARAAAPLLRADADLRVVCLGGGALLRSETDLLDSLKARERFVQVSVSDAQLVTLYRAARAFVFPSRYEGFGIPIVEAFSCGCPCAISQASCFGEVAGDAAVYFDPDDEASMSEAMHRVLHDGALRAALVERGYARARSFSWEDTARRTLAVYADACGAARSAS